MKIYSVDKAITVLNCFSSEKPVLGVGGISKMTGFTLSTVSRLLSTLEARGVVEKAERYGEYQLGYRIYLWGILSQKRNNLAAFAKPVMEKLGDKCGEEVSLYVIADNHRICFERVPSKQAIAMVGPVGKRLPLHAGASGRVLLAFLPQKRRKEILAQQKFERFTPRTITDPVELEKKLEEIRDKGYGISKGEREPGAYSVVAPIWDANNSVIASLCIAGPIYRLSAEQLDLNIKSVLGATVEISKKMGHTA